MSKDEGYNKHPEAGKSEHQPSSPGGGVEKKGEPTVQPPPRTSRDSQDGGSAPPGRLPSGGSGNA
jgi:hypothetical protein